MLFATSLFVFFKFILHILFAVLLVLIYYFLNHPGHLEFIHCLCLLNLFVFI